MRSNKGLHLCGYGIPGQLFYSLNLPEPEADQKQGVEEPIRAIVSMLEGRGTKFRIMTELQYLMDSKWNWNVKKSRAVNFW